MSIENEVHAYDLQKFLLEIASKYEAEFAENAASKKSDCYVVKLIEKELPLWITTHILGDGRDLYKVEGSAGKGRMTHIPWIAIMDKSITTSATKGCYLVYLLSIDRQRIYLSFGIGAQALIKKGATFTKERIQLMEQVIESMREQIQIPERFSTAQLRLGNGENKLPYEVGTVCSKEYNIHSFPSNEELVQDLQNMLAIYRDYCDLSSEIGVQTLQMEGNQMGDLNTILYGPPGTGKTFKVIEKAVNIIDPNFSNMPRSRDEYEEAYQMYIEKKQIQFCTFHQSFSYEDFVEGLRSDIEKEGAPFTPQNGIFKEICELAKSRYQLAKNPIVDISQSTFYKISLGRAGSDEGDKIYRYCITNKVISLGHISESDFSEHDTFEKVKGAISNDEQSSTVINMINNFRNEIKVGDLVIISNGNLRFRAIGKVTGDYYYDEETEIPYNHFREVEWLFISNSRNDAEQILTSNFSQLSIYPLNAGQLKVEEIKKLIAAPERDEDERFVLIIDEINRGNISKIFGELITLIEDDKRFDILEDGTTKGLEVTLPYSKDRFSVPKNVYLLGTMNTADRSISLMDTALRRRFKFEEMLPNIKLLDPVENIDVGKLLKTINERIEFLYDRDHQIGHAFFMGKETIEELIEVIKHKVLPLLQEYFYDDWEKIELVLGGASDSVTEEENYFLVKKKLRADKLFNKTKNLRSEKVIYSIVKKPTSQALINIYQSDRDDSDE